MYAYMNVLLNVRTYQCKNVGKSCMHLFIHAHVHVVFNLSRNPFGCAALVSLNIETNQPAIDPSRLLHSDRSGDPPRPVGPDQLGRVAAL